MPESTLRIAALRDPARYPHAVAPIEVVETHISWVILTGPYAYKIKKPVNLGFVDFSTLEARHHYCEAELRLNRRLAPSLYEAVVKITGSADDPIIGGNGTAIEYALRMREFPQHALASRLLVSGALQASHIDALAARIAAFHAHTGAAARGSAYGTPEAVIKPARDNFTALGHLLTDSADRTHLTELRTWTEHEYQQHWALFDARHAEGRVRECHGDLHLGNIVMLDGALTPFDCIEFDTALRWIDVMSEVAFLVMDLMDRGRSDFAYRFLNVYLETSGDYAGLALLRFYLAYRALVRAKIHALRSAQAGVTAGECTRLMAASRGYLELAGNVTRGARSAIFIMHGYSGSGKSVLAQEMAEAMGAIRLRSDVERKRISGLASLERSASALASGIYTTDLTSATYHRLLDLARLAIQAGYAAMVDATCLKRWQRDLFRREAAARHIPFVIVDVTAPTDTLRERIAARQSAGGDASEADLAVLEHQIAGAETLSDDELSAAIPIDTAGDDTRDRHSPAWTTLRAALHACIGYP